MTRTSRRQSVAACLVGVLMVATACQPARVGTRCRVGVARDRSHLLVCQRGRWVRSVTLVQLGQIIAERASAAAPAFDVDTLAADLARPWDVAFLADGTPLVTERAGRLVAVRAGARQVITTFGDVEAVGEGGAMGLVVDPNYADNRRVYVCLRSRASGSADVRVARLVLDSSGSSLVARDDIVTGIPAGVNHVGCRVRFGPDAALWVTTGDALGGTVPQSPTSLGGKVLRVTTDGAPVLGNPGGSLDPRIFSLGHRNPQGIAFRVAPGSPEDGRPFSVEHGPDRDDEVNRLVVGGNYGWNPVGSDGSYNQSVPMTSPGAIAATWRSGSPTVAPSGATFVAGPTWGAWQGALAIANLKASRLHVLRLDAEGRSVEREWVALTDRGRLRSVVQGPDGALYVVTDVESGSLLRLAPRR